MACLFYRKKVFAVLLRQFSELIDALMKQAVQLHSQMMATSILFDADSTDWSSYKDFYEVILLLTFSVNHRPSQHYFNLLLYLLFHI